MLKTIGEKADDKEGKAGDEASTTDMMAAAGMLDWNVTEEFVRLL